MFPGVLNLFEVSAATGGFDRFLHREGGVAPRYRHAELAQDFFALVFVDLHRGLTAKGGSKQKPPRAVGWG